MKFPKRRLLKALAGFTFGLVLAADDRKANTDAGPPAPTPGPESENLSTEDKVEPSTRF